MLGDKMENKKKSNEKFVRLSIKIPISLVERMAKIKKLEGINLTFQMNSGAEMYLKTKEKTD